MKKILAADLTVASISRYYNGSQAKFSWETAIRTEAMIAVKDVERASAWYQSLLGIRSNHGGPCFDQLIDAQGKVVLLLHYWGDEHHPSMLRSDAGPISHGLVLYFRVDRLQPCIDRARAAGAAIVQPPFFNEQSHQHELQLRDPDGYFLVICAAAV